MYDFGFCVSFANTHKKDKYDRKKQNAKIN